MLSSYIARGGWRLFSETLCALSVLQGLYCISVNCMDNAEAQFTTALRVSKW